MASSQPSVSTSTSLLRKSRYSAVVRGDGAPAGLERLRGSIRSAMKEDVREVMHLEQIGQEPQEQVVLLGAPGLAQTAGFLQQMAPDQLETPGEIAGQHRIGRPAMLEDGPQVAVGLENVLVALVEVRVR